MSSRIFSSASIRLNSDWLNVFDGNEFHALDGGYWPVAPAIPFTIFGNNAYLFADRDVNIVSGQVAKGIIKIFGTQGERYVLVLRMFVYWKYFFDTELFIFCR